MVECRYEIKTITPVASHTQRQMLGPVRKEDTMEGMTDKQYESTRETLLLLVLEILKNSESLEEARKKVEALLPNK